MSLILPLLPNLVCLSPFYWFNSQGKTCGWRNGTWRFETWHGYGMQFLVCKFFWDSGCVWQFWEQVYINSYFTPINTLYRVVFNYKVWFFIFFGSVCDHPKKTKTTRLRYSENVMVPCQALLWFQARREIMPCAKPGGGNRGSSTMWQCPERN